VAETDAAWKAVCLCTQHLCHCALQAAVQRNTHYQRVFLPIQTVHLYAGFVNAWCSSNTLYFLPVSNFSAQLVTCNMCVETTKHDGRLNALFEKTHTTKQKYVKSRHVFGVLRKKTYKRTSNDM